MEKSEKNILGNSLKNEKKTKTFNLRNSLKNKEEKEEEEENIQFKEFN